MAHSLRPIVRIGQGGVNEAILRAIDQALVDHELIKIRLFEPTDKKSLAQEVADGTQSAICGLIGHTVILYRPHPEEPKISLGD